MELSLAISKIATLLDGKGYDGFFIVNGRHFGDLKKGLLASMTESELAASNSLILDTFLRSTAENENIVTRFTVNFNHEQFTIDKMEMWVNEKHLQIVKERHNHYGNYTWIPQKRDAVAKMISGFNLKPPANKRRLKRNK